MKFKKTKLNLCLCSLVAGAALVLSACSSNAVEKQIAKSSAFGPLNLTVPEYQQAYDDSSKEQRFKSLILLARSKIVSGDVQGAASCVNDLYVNANSELQKNEAALVKAMLESRTGSYKEAAETLSEVNYKILPKQTLSYFLILNSNVNARLYQKTSEPKYEVAAFRSKVTLLRIIDKKSDRVTLINQCLELLSKLDDKTIAAAMNSSNSNLEKGFIEYSIISRSESEELKEQALSDFRQKYGKHPVTEILSPAAEDNNSEAEVVQTVIADAKSDSASGAQDPATPAEVNENAVFDFKDGGRIAVLLPLTGRFAPIVGEPAKLGILAALKDRKSSSKVVFYDTNKSDISQIVQKISSDGTSLVIGPVLKPEVQALNQSGIKIPSVVFNSTTDNKPVNQWYFNLSPDYEGVLAASKIYDDSLRNPVVIAHSSDSSSQRAAAAFTEAFSAVNDRITTCYYTDANDAKASLAKCPLDKADSVYISASAVDAVQIKSVVPSSLPVYLTDKSYMGLNNSAQELALKGAKLGDMPWLLTDSPLKSSFMQALPKANPQVQRIFAAAYDSVAFALVIKRLSANKNDVLHGLSGDISLGKNGLIETAPLWVELGSIR
ncbi:MAG: penicillin-binding protein activator [Succinivibrio sp.]